MRTHHTEHDDRESPGLGATPIQQSDLRRNVVALAVTPWHALGVEAFVCDSLSAGARPKGIVIIPRYDERAFCVSEDAFPNCRGLEFRFLFVDRPLRAWDHVRSAYLSWRLRRQLPSTSVGCDVLVPRNPRDILPLIYAVVDARVLKGLRFTTIDEGIASYKYQLMPKLGWLDEADRLLSRRWLLRLLARQDDALASAAGIATRYVFELDGLNGSLRPRPDVAPTYRRLIRGSGPPPELEATSRRARALFLSEPNAEYGLYSRAVEMGIVRRAVTELAARGYSVLVKPHPSETIEQYRSYLSGLEEPAREVRFLLPATAAEHYISHLDNRDVVVGIASSALITSGVLFERSAYTVAELAFEEFGITRDSSFGTYYSEFAILGRSVLAGGLKDVPVPSC